MMVIKANNTRNIAWLLTNTPHLYSKIGLVWPTVNYALYMLRIYKRIVFFVMI